MNIDLDEELGSHHVDEAKKKTDEDGTGRAVKQEQDKEASSIYISSDSDKKKTVMMWCQDKFFTKIWLQIQ